MEKTDDYQIMYQCESCGVALNKDEVYKIGPVDDFIALCENCWEEQHG